MADNSFYDDLYNVFLLGGVYSVIFYTTSYLIDKTIQHNGEIEKLFSRLEKCEKNHESSHELKK